MLVLSRKRGESIVVGDAEIRVESIDGNRVKLSIAAPRSVHVRRSELPPQTSNNDKGSA